MIVVSDTTPLSELAKVGKLDILRDTYGKILIPQEVYDEITTGSHPAIELIEAVDWIEVRAIEDREAFTRLQQTTRLGRGECAAMILAEALNADQLLIDDLAARRVALSRGLPVIGTIGTLLLAKQRGLIDSVKVLLDDLINAGKWISPQLYEEVLGLAKEEK
jgi:uncharacterized protein